jgi:hypothetical protein
VSQLGTLQVANNISQQKMLPSSQTTLFDFKFFKPHATISSDDPDVFGHVPQQIDSARTFRIILQNPNGIKPSVTEPDFMFSLHLCHEVGAGAICLAETNINWHHYQHSAALRRCLHRNWSSSRFQTSVPEEIFLGNYQPGGTATLITDRWTSRVTKSGVDPFGLGRWSYVMLRGKSDISICIITAYRVCNDKSTGPKTAYQQQKRHLAALFRQSNKVVTVDPFRQFVLDLQSWISSIQADGTQIILCLDNNEELLESEGQIVSLPLSSLPAQHKTHDGRLETLARSVGLVDVLRNHHPSPVYPATYNRGRKRIDLILVSASLLKTVKSSGILPYNSIFQGDHRPCYIDLDAEEAFGGKTAPISPPCQRCLQMHDPRKVSAYLDILTKQLDKHNIFHKVSNLQKKDPAQWHKEDYIAYERLDKLITEAMLYAERAVSSRYTKTWEWSPVMVSAVYAERFWRLALKKSSGRLVSDGLLNRTRTLAGIPQIVQPLSLPEILQCLAAARQSRRALQKDSQTLRKNYLTGLASALVLKRAPYLGTDPKYDEKLTLCTVKEVKRLIRLEHKRHLYHLIGRQLGDENVNRGGLTRADVPAPMVEEGCTSSVYPKQWTGPWVSITDPSAIAQYVCQVNTKQYNQAQYTPFGSSYLMQTFGMNLEGQAARDIIHGTFSIDPDIQLLPETHRIINRLNTPLNMPALPTVIKKEEFQATYSIVKERTSSSVSGRHVGHYKAAIQDDNISSIHATMMSLSYMVGFSPERWRKVVDVMLEKEPGNPKIHRLRIIALIESDYNQSQRILIARRLSHRMEDMQLIPEMQYGSRPGKLCLSPVLNKQLTHDIIRQTKRTAAIIENDAIGCYDRLMNPLVLLAMRWLGVPETLAKSVALTWSGTSHSIKTYFGISQATYSNTKQTPLFGPGQGSTTGPTLWQVSFVLLEDSATAAGLDISSSEEEDKEAAVQRLPLVSSDGSTQIDNGGEAFVDDANLVSSSSVLQHPHEVSMVDQKIQCESAVRNLQVYAQQWERALFSTGGAINISKSFWFVFNWKWSGGVAKLAPPPSSVTLKLTEGSPDNDPVSVPQISVQDTYRTLGVRISPSGSTKQTFQDLSAKALDYQAKIIHSKLPREAALLSYNMYLLPKLGYSLPALTLSETECHRLQSATLAAFLPKIQLNRHIPRSVVFGSTRFGGLNIRSLYSIQGFGQLTLFTGHIRAYDKTAKLLRISLSYLQLTVGSATNVLMLPATTYHKWTDSVWLTSFWAFMRRTKLLIDIDGHWLPEATREFDVVLMDYFVEEGYSAAALGSLNRCRLYLQVITLADISSADGSYIIPEALQGIPLSSRRSRFTWPNQQCPPHSAWELWRSALRSLQPKNKLDSPLGRWLTTNLHQQWLWFQHPSSAFLYFRDTFSNCWIQYEGFPNPGRKTRSSAGTIYDMSRHSVVHSVSPDVLPTTVTHDRISGCTSATPGPQRPTKHLSSPAESIKVEDRLSRHEYFRSMFPVGEFLSELEVTTIVEEYSKGISIVTRSFYDPQALTQGWTVYSTTSSLKLYTTIHTKPFTPGVSSDKRQILECICHAIFSLRVIGEVHNISGGNITLYCNSKGTTNLLRRLRYHNVTTALDDNGDVLTEIKYQLRKMEKIAKMNFQHCDLGTKTGNSTPKQFVDELGTAFNSHRLGLSFPLPAIPFLNPPHNAVSLRFEGKPLLTQIRKTLRCALYRTSICTTICKQEGWSIHQFNQVDWTAHELAFQQTWSSKRITYTKLAHALLNTNVQNHKYYGKSALCPCCGLFDETLQHVFTCVAPEVIEFRRKQQDILWNQLDLINTPTHVENDIKQGILSLEAELHPTDLEYSTKAGLAQAAFLRGRISTQRQYDYNGRDEIDWVSSKWAGRLVLSLLQYSQQLWVYRCGILHGHDKEEIRQRHREDLLHQIQDAYEDYHRDPFCVPSDWRSLFHRPLHIYSLADRDSLACWIRSYSEARQQQALLDTQQRQVSMRSFAAFKPATIAPLESLLSSSLHDSDTSTVASDSLFHDIDDDTIPNSPYHLSDATAPWDGGDGVPWEREVCLDDLG